jgi:hypothetical protein
MFKSGEAFDRQPEAFLQTGQDLLRQLGELSVSTQAKLAKDRLLACHQFLGLPNVAALDFDNVLRGLNHRLTQYLQSPGRPNALIDNPIPLHIDHRVEDRPRPGRSLEQQPIRWTASRST